MKILRSKFRRKSGASLGMSAHRDLRPPPDPGVSEPQCPPQSLPTRAGWEPDASEVHLAAPAETTEDKLHLDSRRIDPLLFENALLPDDLRVEAPEQRDLPASQHEPSRAVAAIEPMAKNEGPAWQKPDPDITIASPAFDISSLGECVS